MPCADGLRRASEPCPLSYYFVESWNFTFLMRFKAKNIKEAAPNGGTLNASPRF